MRFGFFAACVISVFLAFPSSPRASGAADVEDNLQGTAQGLAVSVFRAEPPAVGSPRFHLTETLRLSGTRVDASAVRLSDLRGGRGTSLSTQTSRKKRMAIAVAASAILPGLGELYCYYDARDRWTLARVPLFFALEGGLWYGYYHNHTKGKDYKRDYEAYADEHWNLDRFLAQHPCCAALGDTTWRQYNEDCQGEFNFFLFTPRESDREEYYENIGKYNAFVYGWDDWANQSDYWTPHRHRYVSLRNDSDAYLKRGDQCIMGLIVNRVVSMIDAGWIAYRMSKGDDPDKGWSIHFDTYDAAPSLIIGRRF